MIESMIENIKSYLPLKIIEARYNGTVFRMYGSTWHFSTQCAWRIVNDSKMVYGCYDDRRMPFFDDLYVLNIGFQNSLKIDPIFILSNDEKLEIFTINTSEPWSFGMTPDFSL